MSVRVVLVVVGVLVAAGSLAYLVRKDDARPALRNSPTPQTKGTAPEIWGGDRIILTMNKAGAAIEYECAAGSIEQPLNIAGDGTFSAEGWHQFESGGPQQPGATPPKPQRARYTGTSTGSSMELTVVLTENGSAVGTFQLERGRVPNLDRCL